MSNGMDARAVHITWQPTLCSDILTTRPHNCCINDCICLVVPNSKNFWITRLPNLCIIRSHAADSISLKIRAFSDSDACCNFLSINLYNVHHQSISNPMPWYIFSRFSSQIRFIICGVQVSVLWPFSLLIYVKDIGNSISSITIELFAEDTTTTTTTTTICWPPGLWLGPTGWTATRKVKSTWIYWNKR